MRPPPRNPQDHDMVDFACPAIPAVDRTYLAREDEAYGAVAGRRGQALRERLPGIEFASQRGFKLKEATLGWFKLLHEFSEPAWVRAVSRANEVYALYARPSIQIGRRELGTCGPGVVRVDVEVSNDTHRVDYRCSPQLRQAKWWPNEKRAAATAFVAPPPSATH
jgi:hypothetical protein